MALLFPAKLQQRVPYSVKMVKTVVLDIWDISLHTQTSWVSSRVYSLALAA